MGLGDGQKIEREMAREVNLKVFHTYTNTDHLGGADGPGRVSPQGHSFDSMKVISKAVQEWYDSGCANADLENVYVGYGIATRPKYQKL